MAQGKNELPVLLGGIACNMEIGDNILFFLKEYHLIDDEEPTLCSYE